MSLRVRLVEPRPSGHNVYDLVHLPRLGLPLMGRMLAEAGHDVRIFCEVLAPVDLDDLASADLVGISSTTATAPAAYRLADFLGAAGVPVVLGGPHVTFRAEEALGHAPFVVRGEGERTLGELVGCIEEGRSWKELPGLSFSGPDGEPCHNPARTRCTQAEFEALPPPDLRLIESNEKMKTKPIMTQWGCPFDCEFCSVTAMFSRSVRHRREEQVLSELAGLGADRVFIYDDNFVVNKARTASLLRSMVAADLTPAWSAQVRADAAVRSRSRPEPDHEFLALMRSAGCWMVMIGVEAISDEALSSIGKRQQVAVVERAIGAFHDHDIAVHGMFVAGLDTDVASTPVAMADFARRLDIDTFQLMVETPLPGTKLWERIRTEDRLLSDDWSLFDGHQVVMRPAHTTALQLQLEVLEAMRHFYSWPRILSSGLLGALSHLPDIAAAARPSFVRRLPHLARIAWARRWDEMAPLLESTLPAAVRSRVASALLLPALRFYARRQLVTWWEQDRSKAHVELLASLAQAGP